MIYSGKVSLPTVPRSKLLCGACCSCAKQGRGMEGIEPTGGSRLAVRGGEGWVLGRCAAAVDACCWAKPTRAGGHLGLGRLGEGRESSWAVLLLDQAGPRMGQRNERGGKDQARVPFSLFPFLLLFSIFHTALYIYIPTNTCIYVYVCVYIYVAMLMYMLIRIWMYV
jgi:hypothetical protein